MRERKLGVLGIAGSQGPLVAKCGVKSKSMLSPSAT